MYEAVFIRQNNQGTLLVIGESNLNQSAVTVASHLILRQGIQPEAAPLESVPPQTYEGSYASETQSRTQNTLRHLGVIFIKI